MSYFLVFSIWDDNGWALPWDATVEWCRLLGLETVPVLYRGVWDEKRCREIIANLDLEKQEGIVVRPDKGFCLWQIHDTKRGVMGKWVRRGHVQTDEHWLDGPVVWNEVKP